MKKIQLILIALILSFTISAKEYHVSKSGSDKNNGIHGSLGGIFSTIEGNTICDIAMQKWISGPDVAGIKLLASIDVLISNNHIYRCAEVGGLWLDWMAQGARVSANLFHDNRRDLFVEVNHGPFMVDNNLFLSPLGLLESSGGGAYVHNSVAKLSYGPNWIGMYRSIKLIVRKCLVFQKSWAMTNASTITCLSATWAYPYTMNRKH